MRLEFADMGRPERPVMPIAPTVITDLSWLVLGLVWLPGYFARRRGVRIANPALQLPANILLLLAFALLFARGVFGADIQVTPRTAGFEAVGLALDLAGVAFAIWARLLLGRNWSGMVLQVKAGHQLVQTGPYAIVRHPIYTGLLAAILGTALTRGTLAAYLAFAAGVAALLIRVFVEEGLMRGEFGAVHEAWRRRTKKLIPFIW
jgi:protein-S-isoprenylcysteine O-methyltransferase Ste14